MSVHLLKSLKTLLPSKTLALPWSGLVNTFANFHFIEPHLLCLATDSKYINYDKQNSNPYAPQILFPVQVTGMRAIL